MNLANMSFDNSQQHIALRAHDDFLKAITQTDGQINSEDLLFALPFDIKYHVITHPCVHLCAKGLHFSAFIFLCSEIICGSNPLPHHSSWSDRTVYMRSVSAFCRTLSRTISARFRSEVDGVRTQTAKATLEFARSLRVQGSLAMQPVWGNSSRTRLLFQDQDITDGAALPKRGKIRR